MFNAIKEIINPDVVLSIATGDQILTIKEQAADSKVKKLHIKNIPPNAFAFTLDYQPGSRENRRYQQLSCYVDISNKMGINKGCDLILLIPKETQCIVLIFDLKSKKLKKGDTEKQLSNSELYVRYLMTMVKSHYGCDINSVKYKRAVVTTAGRKGVHKKPIYKPNEKPLNGNSFHTESVRVNKNKEAYVYLGAMIK